MSLEFHFIMRQFKFQFQNQYSKRETVITIPVYHLLVESTGKASKKSEILIEDERNRKEANDRQKITQIKKKMI